MRVIIFILLKLAELAGVCGVGFLIYLVGSYFNPNESFSFQMLCGFAISVSISFGAILLWSIMSEVIPSILKANWKWADKITDKFKGAE